MKRFIIPALVALFVVTTSGCALDDETDTEQYEYELASPWLQATVQRLATDIEYRNRVTAKLRLRPSHGIASLYELSPFAGELTDSGPLVIQVAEVLSELIAIVESDEYHQITVPIGLGHDLLNHGFDNDDSANAASEERCDELQRDIDMKRDKCVDINDVWYACAQSKGPNDAECLALQRDLAEAAQEWLTAIAAHAAAGC